MPDLTIRRMEPEDLELVFLLDCMSFSLPWSLNSYKFELTNPASRPWVVEVTLPPQAGPLEYNPPHPVAVSGQVRQPGEKAILAMIVLWLIMDEGHIATIAVHPEWRRMGIARKLLRHALEQAAREGARTVMLDVRDGNFPAQALYAEFGFEVVGRRPGYYKDNGEDALLMTATLERRKDDR
ncbi:MAG: ribosomal protein S18-alanine N-acetyltransferase [Chloroflexota bacterium]